MNWFQVVEYIEYLFNARHRKGYGIHSPFVFYLVREIIYDKHRFNAFEIIDKERNLLLKNSSEITVASLGATSRVSSKLKRTISSLAKNESMTKKKGELLFKMIACYKPVNILEIGTSIGLGTLYFALTNTHKPVYTIEGSAEKVAIAKELFKKHNLRNVIVQQGLFEEEIAKRLAFISSLGMVYFDGNHTYRATIDYFNQCLAHINNDSFFVFDDIHWSLDMKMAWNEISKHPQVTVSIDLFHFGILFFRRENPKQHFIVRW